MLCGAPSLAAYKQCMAQTHHWPSTNVSSESLSSSGKVGGTCCWTRSSVILYQVQHHDLVSIIMALVCCRKRIYFRGRVVQHTLFLVRLSLRFVVVVVAHAKLSELAQNKLRAEKRTSSCTMHAPIPHFFLIKTKGVPIFRKKMKTVS